MALGLGLMLGLRLPENFNSPYKSTGIVDFWRRWHITLSAWLRDFLYIPLGGNRAGRLMQYRNLFLTMLIGGAWHGAGWTFMVWGALHGLMLCVNHFFRAGIKGTAAENVLAAAPLRLLSIAFTFLCINFCWVVFRALSLDGALRDVYSHVHGAVPRRGAGNGRPGRHFGFPDDPAAQQLFSGLAAVGAVGALRSPGLGLPQQPGNPAGSDGRLPAAACLAHFRPLGHGPGRADFCVADPGFTPVNFFVFSVLEYFD